MSGRVTDGAPPPRRSPGQSAALVVLFTVVGVVTGAVAFLGLLALVSPTLGLGGVRDASDALQSAMTGGVVLLLPILITAVVRITRTRSPVGVARWLLGCARLAALFSAGIGPLVLVGMFIAGLPVDSGTVVRMTLASAGVALCGGMSGLGAGLATLRSRPAPAESPASVFD